MLLPILGFINIFFMRYSLVSDHWQYQATPAILAYIASGGVWMYKKVSGMGVAGGSWSARRRWTGLLASVIGAALMGYTFHIAWIYRTPESIWQNTLAHNPESWMAHVKLGSALLRQQRYEDAITHYSQATRIAPDILDNWENLGNALVSDGRTDEGLKLLEWITEKDPNRATVYNSLGHAYMTIKQPEEAIRYFKEAIARNPSLVDAHFYLGRQLMEKSRYEEARGEFDYALKLAPDFADAAFFLGGCLAGEGRYTEAIPYMEQAVRLRPDWRTHWRP